MCNGRLPQKERQTCASDDRCIENVLDCCPTLRGIESPKPRAVGACTCGDRYSLLQRGIDDGYVVQRMFSDVEADLYVMVDGDGTYPPAEVHKLIAPALNGEADMVVGSRLMEHSSSQFKAFNHIGNRIFWGRHQRYLQGEVVGYP